MPRNMLIVALLVFVCGCAQKAPPPEDNLAPYKLSAEARSKDRAYAYLDYVRSDLTKGKVKIINKTMKLTPAEADTFWPLYHKYEGELHALGDKRLELTRRFVNTMQAGKLDDSVASQIGSAWWDYEAQRTALVKKYYDSISKEISSPIRAAQFAQIEHRVNTVVDLLVASDLPLVGTDF